MSVYFGKYCNNIKNNDLNIGYMVKITICFNNAFVIREQKYLGPVAEHIWCKILEKNNNYLVVLVSNDSYFSTGNLNSPLKYGDKLKIKLHNIRIYKNPNSKEQEKLKEELIKFLQELPITEKEYIKTLPESEKCYYIQNLFSKKSKK